MLLPGGSAADAEGLLTPYNQTLYFETEFPLWDDANATLLAERFIELRPIVVQTGLPGNSFVVPVVSCADAALPVECSSVPGAAPTGRAGVCTAYFRTLSVLESVRFIVSPSTGNGTYAYGLDACSLRYVNLTAGPISAALYEQELAQQPSMYWCDQSTGIRG